MMIIIGSEWYYLVMAVEFSLSELQLRRRQNTLAAKSISTDGTEGNLLRNFQVLASCENIEDENLWKLFVKKFHSTPHKFQDEASSGSVEMFSAISEEASETVRSVEPQSGCNY